VELINVYFRWMLGSYFGIKVYWDGKFLSSRRSGSHLPPYIQEGLPPFPLEGVIWYEGGEERGTHKRMSNTNSKNYRMQGSANFLKTKDPDYWKHAILYISLGRDDERPFFIFFIFLFFLIFCT
jgi:hypothetical protein